jgi:hypothetical protein
MSQCGPVQAHAYLVGEVLTSFAQAIAKSGRYAAEDDGVDDELDEEELQHEIEL